MDIKLDFNIFENTTTDIHMEMNIFVDVLTHPCLDITYYM